MKNEKGPTLQFRVDAGMSDAMEMDALSPVEKQDEIKRALESLSQVFIGRCDALGTSRELSLAKTKMEEARMWAFLHLERHG
jgi:hypothetical protein